MVIKKILQKVNFRRDTLFAKQVIKSAIEDYKELYTLPGRSLYSEFIPISLPISSEYFVSCEKGVYHITGKGIQRVFDLWTMGIAVKDTDVYLASTNRKRTYIIKGRLDSFFNEKRPYKFQELYSERIFTSSHRIHQICVAEDSLWVANTPRNTLLQIDRHSGKKICEIAPFRDRFGAPVLYDNNHINSVFPCGDCLLFVAYRAGNKSLIGVYGNHKIVGYGYENVGVHDIFITRDDIIFSDTFGPGKPDSGGYLIVNGKPFHPEFFEPSPGFIVRGVSGNGSEMLIGHSHKGIRSERFKGTGSLLISKNGKVTDRYQLPFAQVYDIIHVSGQSFKHASNLNDFAGICEKIESILGCSLR